MRDRTVRRMVEAFIIGVLEQAEPRTTFGDALTTEEADQLQQRMEQMAGDLRYKNSWNRYHNPLLTPEDIVTLVKKTHP